MTDKKITTRPDKENNKDTEIKTIGKADEKNSDQKSETPVSEWIKKYEEAEQEAKATYDRLLRTTAEFENYKKRTAREIDEFRKYANGSMLKEFLPVVDNLELALKSSKEDKNTNTCVLEGVEMTLNEILKIFKNFSVKPIESLEKPFDPNYHEAVMQEETNDFPDNTVIKELQKGYILYDRLLRPAMVVVSKMKSAPVEKQNNQKKDDE